MILATLSRNRNVKTMKKYIIAIFVFGVITLTFSCTTTRYTSYKSARGSIVKKGYLILHTPQTTYNLVDYEFNEENLRGTLKGLENQNKLGLHVYTDLNFDREMAKDTTLHVIIPKPNIEDIQTKSFSLGKTILLVWLCFAPIYSASMVLIYGL